MFIKNLLFLIFLLPIFSDALASPSAIRRIETIQCWEDLDGPNSDLDYSEPCEEIIEYLILDGQENLYGIARTSRALMSGDKETGICTIKMVRELDSGPILAREKFVINSNETNTSLSHKLSKIGALQLLEVINNFEFISEIPQESDGITYASKIQKSETRINWNLSGIVVDRLIRSLSEKPGAWCILNGSRVKILNSKYVKLEGKTGHNIISSENKSSLIIACREGAVEIMTLQKEGKKPISAKEFLSGYKENNIYFN